MDSKNIRNFCIIAHIDHGKSTLADRFLEVTNTIEKRKMKEQFLDQMELERERGITIKMQPVRMIYEVNHSEVLIRQLADKSQFPNKFQTPNPNFENSLKIKNSKLKITNSRFILNLIDTPGHIDFSYEVSRALKAVEGAVLLVDAAQGVQAQTITNVEMARETELVIIPVLNKIDLPSAMVEESKDELVKLLNCSRDEILSVSAKTGEGISELLEEIIKKVPAPESSQEERPRALIFDFEYSPHQGVILYARMINGRIKKGDELLLSATKERFIAGETGIFSPVKKQAESLSEGEIGYVVTNIKRPNIATVGDTITSFKNPQSALSGYMQPKPVVWASIYPESQNDFDFFRQALERLRLSDSSLVYEEEASGALGRGFRCGFLGMLHLEIIIERLKREFKLGLIVAAPTITYKIDFIDGFEKEIYSPMFFPDQYLIKKIHEPWVEAQVIAPIDKTGAVVQILYEHEAELGNTEPFGDIRNLMNIKMPLRELMRNFFDELKSATSGYGSLNYKVAEMRQVEPGQIVRLDVLVAEDIVPAFSKIVSKDKVQSDAEEIAEKLKNLLPRELFVVKIQAKAMGRILASRSIPALKKDVTGYLYGGDRTRKMKLWQKQKRGKERLKKMGRVNIPQEVFIKVMQNK